MCTLAAKFALMKRAKYGIASPEYVLSTMYIFDMMAITNDYFGKPDTQLPLTLKIFTAIDPALSPLVRHVIINYIREYIDVGFETLQINPGKYIYKHMFLGDAGQSGDDTDDEREDNVDVFSVIK